MSNPGNGPRGPIVALMARWWLAVILVIVGAVAGYGIASQVETHYTAEARLIVGADNLSSYQVAGFATASQELASNYARYVDNSSTLSSSLGKDLGTRDSELIQISASPIPQSSVVSIETVATTRSTAIAAAQSVAMSLVKLTANPTANYPSTLLKSYESLAKAADVAGSKVTNLTQRLQTAKTARKSTFALSDQLSAAKLRSETLNLQRSAAASKYQSAVTGPESESQLNLLQPASIISINKSQTRQIYMAGGAIAGLVVALALAALLERRHARLPSDSGARPAGVDSTVSAHRNE